MVTTPLVLGQAREGVERPEVIKYQEEIVWNVRTVLGVVWLELQRTSSKGSTTTRMYHLWKEIYTWNDYKVSVGVNHVRNNYTNVMQGTWVNSYHTNLWVLFQIPIK